MQQSTKSSSVLGRPGRRRRTRGISLIALLFFVALAYGIYAVVFKPGDKAGKKEAASAGPVPLRIVIYSKPSCEPCDRAKAWMTQRRIAFEDRDVEFSSAYKEQVEAYKSQIVPVIVVNGEPQFGFLPAHLEDVIENAKRGKH